MEITYAYTVTSESDPYVQSMEEVGEMFAELGNNQLLNYFKFCKSIQKAEHVDRPLKGTLQ